MDQPARSKRKFEDENLDPAKNQKGETTTPHSPTQSSDLSSGLVRSSTDEQNRAKALVDTLGAYEGGNIPAHLDLIAHQLEQLGPFLAPEGEGGAQAMWDDNDPMLDIMTRGLTLIYTHIEKNSPLKKTCEKDKLAIVGVQLGTMEPPKTTFLSFLKDTITSGETCSQSVQGELLEWIPRLREQAKELS